MITDFKSGNCCVLIHRLSYISRLTQWGPRGLISSCIVDFIYFSQFLTPSNSLWKLSQSHCLLCFPSVSFKVITKQRRKSPGGGGGGLPYNRLMGMCRWAGSLFHNWIDYNGVAHFRIFGGRTVLHIHG